MAAKEKSLWVQVMEAGFGATLEAHGFRRVSPRLYRLEGDGITWEQFTYRGLPSVPGSFREGFGLVVPGADEIYREAFGRRMTIHYGGRVYLTRFIGGIDSMSELTEYIRMRDSIFWSIFYSIRPNFFAKKHYLESRTRHFGVYYNSPYWHPRGEFLEEVAKIMSNLWIEFVWKKGINDELSLLKIAQKNYGLDRLGKKFFNDYAIIFNYLAGDIDMARRYLLDTIRFENMDEREIALFFTADDPYYAKGLRHSDPAVLEHLQQNVERAKGNAVQLADQARKLAKVLDIAI